MFSPCHFPGVVSTWGSDEVPGSVVSKHGDTPLHRQPQLPQPDESKLRPRSLIVRVTRAATTTLQADHATNRIWKCQHLRQLWSALIKSRRCF